MDQEERETLQKQLGEAKPDKDWFVNARFGLFIHWGLYAMAARHEWVKSKEPISARNIANLGKGNGSEST